MFSLLRKSHRPISDVPLSVVIPVYNHEEYLEEAIESVLAQTVSVREIICIDDGSKDDSFAIAKTYAKSDPRFRVWTRPNQGANRTINEGIKAASGTYVAILNSDDVYEPQRLGTCLEILERDPDASVVSTGISFIDGRSRPNRNEWYTRMLASYRASGDLASSLVQGNFLMTTSNIVARRSVFDEIGAFDDLRYAHDLDFFLRLIACGKRITIVTSDLVRYRYHATNTISESQAAVRLEVAACVAAFVRRISRRETSTSVALTQIRRVFKMTDVLGLTHGVAYFLARPEGAERDPLMPSSYLADSDVERLRAELSP